MVPTRQDQRSCPGSPSASGRPGPGDELVTRPVHELGSLEDVFQGALPAFGGAQLRRVWQLLDQAIGLCIPMSLAVSGPVTLSGQGLTWLNPLLDTGWFMLVSTTDAVCYHDGHRALNGASEHPFFNVDIAGDDKRLRDERTIRVTDVAFSEDVLLEQDVYLRALLREPEFQRKMSGTEFRYLLGQRYDAQEKRNGVSEGLLALCSRMGIPIFVGAPSDGSVFLNSLALWVERETHGTPYDFELDLHREVLESCAFHRWGVHKSEAKAIGTLILGGGVPKNFNLQPEPTLGQILGFDDVPGYLYDIQITTAPVTDGSLSSCPPAEAVTWGKVDKDTYQSTCVSMSADYTTVMPFVVRGLLEKRARLEMWMERMGEDELFAKHPEARGYLRPRAGYRLMDQREELTAELLAELAQRPRAAWPSTEYDLA